MNSARAAISRAMAFISKAILKMVMVFSSLFVRLNWPDVNEAKAGVGVERERPRQRRPCGEKLHKRQRRKQTALDVLRHRLDRDDVQDERGTIEGKSDDFISCRLG